MKTPTLEEVKEYFKNAKEVKCLFTEKIYDILKAIIREDNKNQFEAYFEKENDYCRLYKFGNYAEIISYIEPTTEVRNSVLLQLADNNSYSEEILKKECPKLFENKLEVGKWYKQNPMFGKLIFCFQGSFGNPTENVYGFDSEGIFKTKLGIHKEEINKYVLATPQVVETALIQEAKKRGYKNGVVVNSFIHNKELEIKEDYKIEYLSDGHDKLHFGVNGTCCVVVYQKGKWAEIIETPTDIITIVEKYGKDKVQEYLNNAK